MNNTQPSIWSMLKRAVVPLLMFELGIGLIAFFIINPLFLALANALVASSGDAFAANSALIGFFTSPVGLATLFTLAAAVLLLFAIEVAGTSIILDDARNGRRSRLSDVTRRVVARLPSLLGLCIIIFVTGLLLLLPVLALTAILHGIWLSDADIYFYINVRPPKFLVIAAIIAIAALLTLAIAIWLLLRWCLCFTASALDRLWPLASLQHSARATYGRRWSILLFALAWALAALIVSVVIGVIVDVMNDALLGSETPLWRLRVMGLLVALAALALAATGAAIMRLIAIAAGVRFYRQHMPAHVSSRLEEEEAAAPGSGKLLAALVMAVIAIAAIGQSAYLMADYDSETRVAITAHRAGSALAPENTMAALRQAIADKADFVEIDVQETRDDVVVVLHDTDLRRVLGVPKSIWDVDYAEIKDKDAGSWFDPRFSSERIPTLKEFAEAAKGKVGLNIELKVSPQMRDLAERTIEIVRETGVEDNTIISSLDANILREVRGIDPSLPVGFIVATGVGNLAGSPVDFFSVSRRVATPATVRRLAATGREVHVWSLSRPEDLAEALMNGADNVIVDNVPATREIIDWFQSLTLPEQTLMRIQLSLGRRPAPPPANANEPNLQSAD